MPTANIPVVMTSSNSSMVPERLASSMVTSVSTGLPFTTPTTFGPRALISRTRRASSTSSPQLSMR